MSSGSSNAVIASFFFLPGVFVAAVVVVAAAMAALRELISTYIAWFWALITNDVSVLTSKGIPPPACYVRSMRAVRSRMVSA